MTMMTHPRVDRVAIECQGDQLWQLAELLRRRPTVLWHGFVFRSRDLSF